MLKKLKRESIKESIASTIERISREELRSEDSKAVVRDRIASRTSTSPLEKLHREGKKLVISDAAVSRDRQRC